MTKGPRKFAGRGKAIRATAAGGTGTTVEAALATEEAPGWVAVDVDAPPTSDETPAVEDQSTEAESAAVPPAEPAATAEPSGVPVDIAPPTPPRPAQVGPRLRDGIVAASLMSARGIPYMMLRSPAGRPTSYLRLTPDEAELARRMDGRRTNDQLIADFLKLSGRYAPEQVDRVIEELYRHHMLENLDEKAVTEPKHPWDMAASLAYTFFGRIFFNRIGARLVGLIAVLGVALFCWRWSLGDIQVFALHDSYLRGSAILIGLFVGLLVVHEFGHAMAAKHYRSKVWGIRVRLRGRLPSVGLDLRDVWLAGRRARAVTNAAGPTAVAFVAGVAAITAYFVPEIRPYAFKLGFVAYIRLFVDLCPLVDRDGARLATDLLEIPNLRARALAWVPRAVRRRTRFEEQDSEGRLVAGYAVLAVGWVAVFVGVGYRVYLDRIAGLLIGLREQPIWLIALVLAVLVAIISPLLTQLLLWLARRARRAASWMLSAGARGEQRRLSILQHTELAGLAGELLPALARRARWVRPHLGQELISAQQQPTVYVVVTGEVDGWSPGDPAGTVRQRLGRGSVLGLAARLAGLPSTLSWRPAHHQARRTTLLELPEADLQKVLNAVSVTTEASIGAEPEVAALLADSPAFVGFTPDQRWLMGGKGEWTERAADAMIPAQSTGDLYVVAEGDVRDKAGKRVPRGGIVGPYSTPSISLATATTAARLLRLPRFEAPTVLPTDRFNYPPLATAAEPPPFTDADIDGDRTLERRLWTIASAVALSMAVIFALVFVPGRAWAEMPSNRVQLSLARGTANVVVDGDFRRLRAGGSALLQGGDQIHVGDTGLARLTFRGGALIVLCPGTTVTLARVDAIGHPIAPRASMVLDDGQMLVDTWARSPAFQSLLITVRAGDAAVVNGGPARFGVSPAGDHVERGSVSRNAIALPLATGRPTCGDGTTLPAPVDTPDPTATSTPQAQPPALPLPTKTPAPPKTPSGGGRGEHGGDPTTRTTTKPPTTTTKPHNPPPPPPPTTGPPTPPPPPPAADITNFSANGVLGQVDSTGALCSAAGELSVELHASITNEVAGASTKIVWSTSDGWIDGQALGDTGTVNAPTFGGHPTGATVHATVTVSVTDGSALPVSVNATFSVAAESDPTTCT